MCILVFVCRRVYILGWIWLFPTAAMISVTMFNEFLAQHVVSLQKSMISENEILEDAGH